jgi:hypothetical protein
MKDKTQAIYFSQRLIPPKVHLTLNGQSSPFVNHVKYLGVIFDKGITWIEYRNDFQHHSSINVWYGMTDDMLIGPIILDDRMKNITI